MLDTIIWNSWAQIAIAALLLAIIATLADWRRGRRNNINAVGFMPWTSISALSFMTAAFCGAIAVAVG